jgi:S-sulfo-L-cysteine synthase (O-acetyl-L-serine-dependent)
MRRRASSCRDLVLPLRDYVPAGGEPKARQYSKRQFVIIRTYTVAYPPMSSSSPPVAVPARTAASVLDLIGRTPLVRLSRLERETPGVELYAKAEWQNPGGSVKDRAAARMIADGEATGRLRPGLTIVDATSGNTGIAYAMVGAARGYKVKLCLPENASPERKLILRAFGAELVLTSALEGTDGAIREVRRIVAEHPDEYFYPDQYSNDSNWRAHFDTTAPEIIEQTSGRITHFVAGLGTSGTFVGTSRRLRQFNPAIRMISFQPDSPFHGLEGMKHMGSAIVPAIYDPTLADEDLAIGTEEAHRFVRRLAREEGLLVGISSGAAVAAMLQVARRLGEGVVVTVFPDGAEKYLTESFWTVDE